MSKMETREYKISFITPAFLGNAEQQAQWRTPPFKALLRQWWRIVVAKEYSYDYRKIREAEGRLLGHAWLTTDTKNDGKRISARKSDIQIRVTPWDQGGMRSTDWPSTGFDKVTTTKDGKGRVRSDLYLGFGSILPPSRREQRASITLLHSAIHQKQEARLSLRFPSGDIDDMEKIFRLIAWFGTTGSRSRNGWGSIDVKEIGVKELSVENLKPISQSLEMCMKRDWPHAIGRDNQGVLVWQSQPRSDWKKAMNILAHTKVKIRRVAKDFEGPKKIGGVQLLGYPAGKAWEIREFNNNARLASQIRFKVINTQEGLRSMIYHLPTKFPDILLNQLEPDQKDWIAKNEQRVMQAIHKYLDDDRQFSRLK